MEKASNKKVKILCILPAFNMCGGIENFIMAYYKNFSENIKMDFITHEIKDDYNSNIVNERGDNVFLMPRISLKTFFSFKKELKNFFEKHHDYDIIHCNMANAAYFYFKYAKKYNINVRIIHSHQNSYADKFTHKLRNIPLIYLGNKLSNTNFACSKLAGDFLFKKKQYYIINNAIDVNKFEFNDNKRSEIRKKLKLKKDDFVLGNVGRLVPQKNQAFLLELLKILVSQNDKYQLVIVGDGELEIELKNKAKKLKIEKNIMFIKPNSEIDKYMCAFDMFVLPSLYEGIGIVNIEAQSTGLKVIASKNVPTIAKVTELMEFLELDVEKWSEFILANSNSYERKNMKKDITAASYNIYEETNKLERLYVKLIKKSGDNK